MTSDQLLQLQKENGASARLVAHHKVVSEVAEELAMHFSKFGIQVNNTEILAMAVIHDIGKIKVDIELSEAGKLHEQVGYEYAQELGIPKHLAQICIYHGRDTYETFSLEVLTVILADKLWKSKRVELLESHICKFVSEQTQTEYWSVFLELDAVFESIAEKGHDRLTSMPALN